MTLATPGNEPGTDLDPWGGLGDDVGLEDVSASDMTIPRIQLLHPEGKFKNSVTNEEFEVLDCILLGLVKQRIMWHPEQSDGDMPMCKSTDFEHGFPTLAEDFPKQPSEKLFPWGKSNFDPANFSAANGVNGLVTLPCDSCIFKEWDRDGWKMPPCSEQHTYPLLYSTDEWATWSPGLLTLQKTGIKPSKTYVSGFAAQKRPLFTVKTKITLTVNSRGTVKFSVPTFVKGEESDRDSWPEFVSSYRGIRDMIRSAPRRNSDAADDTATAVPADPDPAANVNTPPAATPPAASPEPAAAPPQPPSDSGDMPF